ncbi:MAG: ABC transporter ATP-binding protein [Alphaproteobacteria bacterium]|nr:ABC transporter ATP-binding protein [Alphaproteobacteria bacterium]
MSKLSLREVSCAFGDTLAVDRISLDIAEGEFVSLLGPSGCGKTTTLRMIAGFIRPTHGTIAVGGRVLSTPESSLPPERRGMSMIFQSYAIWPNMTVAENVGFGLAIRGLGASEVRAQVDRMLGVVRLGDLRERYPAELSGGQQQRVALGRAMVVNPEVLLLDEPLSNLDANLREEMRGEIRRLHEEFRYTTVYVTHDQAEAMATSDRIVVMNRGRIEQVADPFTLYNRPRTRFVAGFIGRTNFLAGRCNGGALHFAGFSLPAAPLTPRPEEGAPVLLSLRPQYLRLSGEAAPATAPWRLQGRILHRTYLGEQWDYLVEPAPGAAPLRVVAPPTAVHEVGASVRIEIDPAQVAVLEAGAD